MIKHHPDDELMLRYAAGTLDTAHRLVVASHAERCAHCRARAVLLDAVGGVLMDQIEPAAVSDMAWERTMADISLPVASSAPERRHVAARPDLPDGATWPRSLDGCLISRWHWLGPGMRWSRVTVPDDKAANVFLLRIGAGKMLPVHTHSDSELVQVLHGEFHDGRALFAEGDFDEADGSILHQPVVQPGGECICLAAVRGRVVFKSSVARMMGSLVGM